MSIVAFPSITPNASSWGLKPNTGAFSSTLNGAVQTIDHGGSRWFCSMAWNNTQDAETTRLRAFVAAMGGMANRTYIRDHTYSAQGSIAVTNLSDALSLSAFSSSGSEFVLSAISDGLRVTKVGATQRVITEGSIATTLGRSYAFTGNMYAVRWTGTDPVFQVRIGSTLYGSEYGTATWTQPDGLRWAFPMTCTTTPVYPGVSMVNASAGTQLDLVRWDCARCLLVDNGLNELTYSEQFDNAAWTKTRITIESPANAYVSPDGATTAEKLIASTDNNTHYVNQASVTKDTTNEFWTFTVFAKADEYNDIQLRLQYDASNRSYATFALDTETVSGLTSEGTFGAAYASMYDAGGGWYRLRITARTGAEASVTGLVMLHNGTSTSFAGNASDGILAWGAQLQQGGQIGRYIQTTTAAATAETQHGYSLKVKGLDESITQQLHAGDMVELNGQLLRLTADLDGDAYGNGVMRFEPKLHRAPGDESAVVLYRPSMRAMMAENDAGWSNMPGGFQSLSMEFIEDVLTD